MLEQSIYDVSDEDLQEAHECFRKTIAPFAPRSIRQFVRQNLAVFPEFALVTERGKSFQNAPHHNEWYNILQSNLIQEVVDDHRTPNSLVLNTLGKVNKYIALEAPREHSKTTVFSVNYPLWRIVNDQNIRIILVSGTSSQAESYLREIKGHIERDPIFNDLFGSMVPRVKEKWTDTEIIVNRNALNLKDPTVSATGMGGVILSRRAELIIVDDILNQLNTGTQEQRQKTKDWFWNTLMPVLTPDGMVVFVGTAWNGDDLLETLIEGSSFDIRVRYKAIPDDTDIDPATGKPRLLWSGLFTYEQLMKKKADEPVAFLRQYQNDVQQLGDAPVKPEHIKWCEKKDVPELRCISIGVDPAVSEKDTASAAQSAVVAVGEAKEDNKFYVLKAKMGYWDFDQLLNEVSDMYNQVEVEYYLLPERVVVEDVQAQKWAIQQLIRRKKLPAQGVRPVNDKTSRLRTLTPFFNNGEVIFVRGCEPLVTQLIGWGKERLKDLVDAFVYAVWYLNTRPRVRVYRGVRRKV